ELAIAPGTDLAGLRFPDDGRLLSPPLVHVAIHAVVREVHAAALEPARPGDPSRGVEHARVRLHPAEAEIPGDGVPVPLGVGHTPPQQLVEGGDPVRAHEAGDARARDPLGSGPPDDLAVAHGSTPGGHASMAGGLSWSLHIKREPMKGVAAVAETLKREGVKFLIGSPVNSIIEGAAQADIRTIIVRQERAGLHMADAVSRVTSGKRIGVFTMQHG